MSALTIAGAVALALQLEAGPVAMQHPTDDTYIELAEPGPRTGLNYGTLAFGAGIRMTASRLRLSAGWRSLGHQESHGPIINDAVYFRCSAARAACPTMIQYWQSKGSTSQTYLEIGYAFGRSWQLVPSVGMAETRLTWHSADVLTASPRAWTGHARTQMVPRPFAGLTLQHGAVGVGVYYLVTDPMRNLAVDGAFPGQGPAAIYLRLTYSIGAL